MTPTNFDELAAYLRNKVEELNDMCSKTDPWVFLCASAFIDYLSKLASGRNSKKAFERYPQFIKDFFPAKYDKFSYLAGPKSNETSLPHQMYYVLRCGIVHSFSFVPEQPARRHGGRPGSVLIAHR